MKLAIISSASLTAPSATLQRTIQELVSCLKAVPGIKILTGGSLGIPGEIVQKAHTQGIHTTAYSPDTDGKNHGMRHDNLGLHYFDEVKYFDGFTVRSLAMIKDADGVLVLNGRMGTLSEVTIALEEGKRVGVLTSTGGITDHLEVIIGLTQKDFPGQIFFSNDPKKVVVWLSRSA